MPKNVKKEYYKTGTSEEPTTNCNWFLEESDIQFQGIFAAINRIDKEQSYRTAMNIQNARLYSNLEILGLSVHAKGSTSGTGPSQLTTSNVTYNLVKSCVDTVSSKIAKNKPRVQFLTSNGDYAQRTQSKKLTRYVKGLFYSSDYYSIASKVFIDGCVFGTGFMKIYRQGNEIKCERVIPEEIKVDDSDAIYGKPKTMFQVKQVSRESLIEAYPDHLNSIRSATSSTPDSSDVDLISVVEAWHLGPRGKHTIAIDNKTLFSEDWKKDYFPFVTYRWSDRLSGYFGQGLAEELTGTQVAINRMLRSIQQAIDLVAVPRVMVNTASKVSAAQITNGIGSLVRYSGAGGAPSFVTPSAMTPEVYNHMKWLISSGYEKTGVSQLSATSKKPAGLDSGAALREFSDLETERFMLTATQYENMALEASKVMINLSRDMFVDDPKLEINVPGDDAVETIKWKDVNLKDSQFVMQAFPVSFLPTTPAGKLAKVQELVQGGLLPQEEALKLLDYPDLAAVESLATAGTRLVEKYVYLMLDEGEYNSPEPQMDLPKAMALANKHYLSGQVTGVPEERLELVLRFIDDAERLQKQKEEIAAIEDAPPEEALPPAVAEPLPESDLLPSQPLNPIIG